jgi:hypothetical protein
MVPNSAGAQEDLAGTQEDLAGCQFSWCSRRSTNEANLCRSKQWAVHKAGCSVADTAQFATEGALTSTVPLVGGVSTLNVGGIAAQDAGFTSLRSSPFAASITRGDAAYVKLSALATIGVSKVRLAVAVLLWPRQSVTCVCMQERPQKGSK